MSLFWGKEWLHSFTVCVKSVGSINMKCKSEAILKAL